MTADDVGPKATTSGFLAEYRADGQNTPRTVHVVFASLVVLVCLGGAVGWITGHIPMPYGAALAAGAPAAGTLLVRAIRMGVLVDGGRIVLRGLVGTRSWPASEVSAFELTERGGRDPRSMIRIRLHDGRRVIALISGGVIRRGSTLVSPALAVDELNAVLGEEGSRGGRGDGWSGGAG